MTLIELQQFLYAKRDEAVQMAKDEPSPVMKAYFLGKMDAFNVAANNVSFMLLEME